MGDPSSNETTEPSSSEPTEPESPGEGDGIVEPDGNELLGNETEGLDENATLENETEPDVLTKGWIRYYNEERPHSSLGYRPPAIQAKVA